MLNYILTSVYLPAYYKETKNDEKKEDNEDGGMNLYADSVVIH